MILNNKSTNPIGYTLSAETDAQKARAKEDTAKGVFNPLANPTKIHIMVFCGVTGNHPKQLLDSPAFINDTSLTNPNEGIEIIDENTPIDKTRLGMNTADAVKQPDFDVVDFCSKVDPKLTPAQVTALEKKQIHCIENIFKLPTLVEIEKLERRSNVLAAIKRQFKSIETSITPQSKSR